VSSDSLSLVLVAHNAEANLLADVTRLLEIAGDLSSRLDLLIIDDGSIDETLTVARELARRYPQINVHHNALRYGQTAALQTAIRETVGEFVFFCSQRPSASQMRQLWHIRTSPHFVMAQPSLADKQPVADSKDLRLIQREALLAQRHLRHDVGKRVFRTITTRDIESLGAPRYIDRTVSEPTNQIAGS
jgi:hypothetical protein